MSLLTICEALALDVGLEVPDVVVSSSNREWNEALSMANAVGEELARRVDWPQLQTVTTVTGTGADDNLDLPADFSRMSMGAGVIGVGGIVRKLTRGEWNSLTATEGTPRYYIIDVSDTPATYEAAIRLWPYLANAATVSVAYQSEDWCNAGDAFSADTDYSLIDEDLFAKALMVRWRRQKGMDYADHEAEYEAALAQFADFFTGER